MDSSHQPKAEMTFSCTSQSELLQISKQPEAFTLYLFYHSIEGEYIPQTGDEVSYRVCSIPPKFEKMQAIHVKITNLTPEVHTKWENFN